MEGKNISKISIKIDNGICTTNKKSIGLATLVIQSKWYENNPKDFFWGDLTEDNVQQKPFNVFRVSHCFYLKDDRKIIFIRIPTYSCQKSENRLLEQIVCHNGSLFHQIVISTNISQLLGFWLKKLKFLSKLTFCSENWLNLVK